MLALPGLIERFSGHERKQVFVVILGYLSFAAAGCLAAQTLLMWTRIAIPQRFWPDYLHTLQAAMPLGSFCCALVLAHQSPMQRAGRALLGAVTSQVLERFWK